MKDRPSAERQAEAGAIRRADIEPYTALRWVGTLFKAAAVFLAVALFTEFMVGLQVDGTAALPELLGELARTVVIAVVLWGTGDLVRLLINVGNDLRAQRVLLARLAHRAAPEGAAPWPPAGWSHAERGGGGLSARELRLERAAGGDGDEAGGPGRRSAADG